MCSIAGFSLSKNSRINPRRLSKALFIEMDSRGNQASGFAWQSNSESGIYKKNVSGASLSTRSMRRNARVAVLHTRYATHGSVKVMENNHPVLSPDREIALVHNGVIYNHSIVRNELKSNLPEVDTAVIPAILQEFSRDVNKFSMLDGDASVAWLDETERLTLKVARISHSPLCIAQLFDGSFVFASTEAMLRTALASLKLGITYLENIGERTLLTVRDGRLDGVDTLPETDPDYEEKLSFNYGHYRNLTSGNHSTSYQNSAYESAKTFGYTEYYDGSGRGYQTPYGEVFVPSEWFKDNDDTAESFGFPSLDGYTVNEYGEYFETDSGIYVGSYDDFIVMNYRPKNGRIERDWWE